MVMKKKLYTISISLALVTATVVLAGFKHQMPAADKSTAPVNGGEMLNHMPIVIRCVLGYDDDDNPLTVAYATGCLPKTNVRCFTTACPFREIAGGALWYHSRPVISDCIVYDGYQWRTVAYANYCTRKEGALCFPTSCP
jgi:hypothetical protein